MELTELTTPAGIAALTVVIVEFIKNMILKKLFIEGKYHSLILIGIGIAVAGGLAWLGIPIFDLSIKTAFMNWILGSAMGVFGYQIAKGTKKTLKK